MLMLLGISEQFTHAQRHIITPMMIKGFTGGLCTYIVYTSKYMYIHIIQVFIVQNVVITYMNSVCIEHAQNRGVHVFVCHCLATK